MVSLILILITVDVISSYLVNIKGIYNTQVVKNGYKVGSVIEFLYMDFVVEKITFNFLSKGFVLKCRYYKYPDEKIKISLSLNEYIVHADWHERDKKIERILNERV